MKLLEGNVRKVLKDTGKDRDFLEVAQQSWQMGLMKLKGFCANEETTCSERKSLLATELTEVSLFHKDLKRPPRIQTIHSINGLRE